MIFYVSSQCYLFFIFVKLDVWIVKYWLDKNDKKITLTRDVENHAFSSTDGVKFAIAWIRKNGMELIDKSYGEIIISQEYHYKWSDASEEICFKNTEVPLESCSITEFTQGLSDWHSQDLTFHWPPQDHNFTLQSNYFGQQFKTVRVDFRVWGNKTYCKPYEEAVQELTGSIVNFLIMTPYFDYSNIENPVKYHIDDSHYLFLNANYFITMDMFIRKNEYTLNDNIFGLYGTKSGVFYSMADERTLPAASNGTELAHIYFNLDNQID